MARIDTLTNFLTDVATAIKDKKGTTDTIKASDFDTEITNLPNGGTELPTKGFVIDECNSSGYATKVTTYGLTSIPSYAFSLYQANYADFLTKYLSKVVLNEGITSIGNYAFWKNATLTNVEFPNTLTTINSQAFMSCSKLAVTSLSDSVKTIGMQAFLGCSVLALTKLPDSLTSLGTYAFQNCKKLAIKTISDGVTSISSATFNGCSGLTQISMKNVTELYGTSDGNGAFQGCSGLKAVWIGSAITSENFGSHAFYKCYAMTHMYIDLPRATVESFTNYSSAFMNDATKTGVIICNDDAEFITKEEFDAIDWATLGE